jgi:hypothetical protein
MPDLDNPATRLHTIFSRYQEGYSPTGGLLILWGTVLGADGEHETRVRAASVVTLIGRVRAQLESLGEPAYLEMFDEIAPDLLDKLVLTREANAQMSDSFTVGKQPLQILRSVGAIFTSSGISRYRIDDSARTDLRESLLAAIEAARTDLDLPARIRAEVVARLHEMLKALDLIDTIGPEDAMAAAERLDFLWNHTPEKEHTGAFRTAWEAAARVWAVVLYGAESAQAIETFSHISQILP